MYIENKNGMTILNADFGYMIRNKKTNTYSYKIYLGKYASLDNFEEVEDKNIDTKLKKKIDDIQDENTMQNELIDISMLAMDEIFCIFEPLLAMTISSLSSEKEVENPMVELYVVMIQRGLKTIDQVPARYRAQVQAILDAIEE